MPKWIPRGSTLYLATDEDAPNFFDPLKDLYVISTIGDFRHAWGEGSYWWNKSSNLFSPEDSVPFDGMMEVEGGAKKQKQKKPKKKTKKKNSKKNPKKKKPKETKISIERMKSIEAWDEL